MKITIIALILVAFVMGWLSASVYRLTIQPQEMTAITDEEALGFIQLQTNIERSIRDSMPKEEYEAMTARLAQRDHEMRVAQLASLNCR